MIAYRLMEVRAGGLATLFHGVSGSRVLETGVWHEARVRAVIDGTGGRKYQSGFHVLPSVEAARAFLRHFRKRRTMAIVECEVPGAREKPGSVALLADAIKIGRVIEIVKVGI